MNGEDPGKDAPPTCGRPDLLIVGFGSEADNDDRVTLAFIPKLTGAIVLMPYPVTGAGLLYTSCFLVISGVELIVSRLLDSRRTFIASLSLLAGIGLDLMPRAFADAPNWLAAFLGSPLAFATTLAILLDLILSLGRI